MKVKVLVSFSSKITPPLTRLIILPCIGSLFSNFLTNLFQPNILNAFTAETNISPFLSSSFSRRTEILSPIFKFSVFLFIDLYSLISITASDLSPG